MKTIEDLRQDLKLEDGTIIGKMIAIPIISLKQSAIEWIKELKECDRKLWEDKEEWETNDFLKNESFGDPYESLFPIMQWIKYFFNIKEEDLNDKKI